MPASNIVDYGNIKAQNIVYNGITIQQAYSDDVHVYTRGASLTLPQFDDTFVLADFIRKNNPKGRQRITVVNNFTQPTMRTGNLSGLDVTLINNGSIIGTQSGADAIILESKLKIVNNGYIRAAGGRGGNGKNGTPGVPGKKGKDKTVRGKAAGWGKITHKGCCTPLSNGYSRDRTVHVGYGWKVRIKQIIGAYGWATGTEGWVTGPCGETKKWERTEIGLATGVSVTKKKICGVMVELGVGTGWSACGSSYDALWNAWLVIPAGTTTKATSIPDGYSDDTYWSVSGGVFGSRLVVVQGTYGTWAMRTLYNQRYTGKGAYNVTHLVISGKNYWRGPFRCQPNNSGPTYSVKTDYTKGVKVVTHIIPGGDGGAAGAAGIGGFGGEGASFRGPAHDGNPGQPGGPGGKGKINSWTDASNVIHWGNRGTDGTPGTAGSKGGRGGNYGAPGITPVGGTPAQKAGRAIVGKRYLDNNSKYGNIIGAIV